MRYPLRNSTKWLGNDSLATSSQLSTGKRQAFASVPLSLSQLDSSFPLSATFPSPTLPTGLSHYIATIIWVLLFKRPSRWNASLFGGKHSSRSHHLMPLCTLSLRREKFIVCAREKPALPLGPTKPSFSSQIRPYKWFIFQGNHFPFYFPSRHFLHAVKCLFAWLSSSFLPLFRVVVSSVPLGESLIGLPSNYRTHPACHR